MSNRPASMSLIDLNASTDISVPNPTSRSTYDDVSIAIDSAVDKVLADTRQKTAPILDAAGRALIETDDSAALHYTYESNLDTVCTCNYVEVIRSLLPFGMHSLMVKRFSNNVVKGAVLLITVYLDDRMKQKA